MPFHHPSATLKEKLAIMYSIRHLIGHSIRNLSAILLDILSAIHLSFSLRDPLSASWKWLAVIVHDSRLGNICGPFGHPL